MGAVHELLLLEGKPELITIHHSRARNKISPIFPPIIP